MDDSMVNLISKLVERLKEEYQPEKIILYGSYAYGQPDRESDIDQYLYLWLSQLSEQKIRNQRKSVHYFLDLLSSHIRIQCPVYIGFTVQFKTDWVSSFDRILHE